MTDIELDQLLDTWQAPAAPPFMRARVLANFPGRERHNLTRPLRWALGMAVASAVLAIGMEQTGHTALDNLVNGVHNLTGSVSGFIDQMWIAHILSAFHNSDPKIYVDGELRTDVVHGQQGPNMWVRFPGEGRYFVLLSLAGIEAAAPQPAGRFDGHVLEFQAGGRAIRIESSGTFGFNTHRPVFVFGPAPGR